MSSQSGPHGLRTTTPLGCLPSARGEPPCCPRQVARRAPGGHWRDLSPPLCQVDTTCRGQGANESLRQLEPLCRPKGRHRRRSARPPRLWKEDLNGPPTESEGAEIPEDPAGDGEPHPQLPELLTQPIDPEDGEDEESDPYVVLLVNATNGFNELGRKAALWTVQPRWAAGARFAFNCYRHSATLILCCPGRPDYYTLQSREDVTQGDQLAMVIYGLAPLPPPLSLDLRVRHPLVLKPWYANDAAMEGRASAVAAAMDSLIQPGPAQGYFPSPGEEHRAGPSGRLHSCLLPPCILQLRVQGRGPLPG
jgi:hypothetical protein